jgi:26S proteasome regulatory subunit N5
MADAAFKPEKDYSKEVDKQIPDAEALAKVPIAAPQLRPRVLINPGQHRQTSNPPSRSSPSSRSRPAR